jgi:hypothetical protein
MQREGHQLFDKSKVLKTDLRRAAFVTALERIQTAMEK